MIKNIWSNVKFFCGHDHKEPIEMAYQQGPDSLFLNLNSTSGDTV